MPAFTQRARIPRIGAAFLVGRNQAQDRERQKGLDAQNAQTQQLMDTLRRFQIDELAAKPGLRQQETDIRQQQLGAARSAIATSGLPTDEIRTRMLLLSAGRAEEALSGIIDGEDFTLGPNQRRFNAQNQPVASNMLPQPTDGDTPEQLEQRKAALLSVIPDLGIPEAQKALFAAGIQQAETSKHLNSVMTRLNSLLPRPTQRVEQTNIAGGTGRETPGARDKIREKRENTEVLRDEITIALNRNRAAPESSGLRGGTARLIEGTVGQAPGQIGASATELAAGISGIDPVESAKRDTHAKSLIARLVPVVTGDTSGRYTKEEQARAQEVQGQLELLRTPAQIEGALSELQAMSLRGDVRTRGQEFFKTTFGRELDIINSVDDVQFLGNVLIDRYGLLEQDARTEIMRYQRMLSQ